MPQVTPTSQQVNAYDLASQWLTALGWPNTPQNQRALAAWFMAESARHGNNVTVVGNNPLNITTATGNYRLVGSHKIAVYPDAQSGAAAFKNLIGSPNHNYPGIVAGFKVGNGIAAIEAIINSGWVTGGNGPSYWHGSPRTNLLQSIFNGLPGGGSVSAFPPVGGEGPGNKGPAPSQSIDPASLSPITVDLANFLGKKPTDTFTAADAKKVNDFIFAKAPWLQGIPFWGDVFNNIAGQFVGKTVGEAGIGLGNTLGVNVGAFNKTVGQDTSGLGNIATALSGFFGSIIFYVALAGGGVLVLFGLYLITKEATAEGSTGAQSIVSPVPVFIRERA